MFLSSELISCLAIVKPMSTLFLIMLPWCVIFMVVMNWFDLLGPSLTRWTGNHVPNGFWLWGRSFKTPPKRLRIMLRFGEVPRNRTTVPGGWRRNLPRGPCPVVVWSWNPSSAPLRSHHSKPAVRATGSHRSWVHACSMSSGQSSCDVFNPSCVWPRLTFSPLLTLLISIVCGRPSGTPMDLPRRFVVGINGLQGWVILRLFHLCHPPVALLLCFTLDLRWNWFPLIETARSQPNGSWGPLMLMPFADICGYLKRDPPAQADSLYCFWSCCRGWQWRVCLGILPAGFFPWRLAYFGVRVWAFANHQCCRRQGLGAWSWTRPWSLAETIMLLWEIRRPVPGLWIPVVQALRCACFSVGGHRGLCPIAPAPSCTASPWAFCPLPATMCPA